MPDPPAPNLPAGPSAQTAGLFAAALQHHQAGRLAPAESLYRKVLAIDPGHIDSLNLLGAIAHAAGRNDLASELIGKAIALNGQEPGFHNNLGNVLQAQGKPDEAIVCYRRALALDPNYADAHYNLGIVLQDQEKPDEAIACYRRALVLDPNHAKAHNNLGNALRERGKPDEAIVCYRRALALDPNYADAHYNQGNALRGQGQLAEAAASYGQALAIEPSHADALNGLAGLLAAQSEPLKSWNLILRSLQIKETREAKRLFVDLVKNLRFTEADDTVRALMVRALSEPWDRPRELAPAVARFATLSRDIGEGVARAARAWPRRLPAQELFGPSGRARIAADPLLRGLLDSAPICDIALERFLTMARHAMLDDATRATVREAGEPDVLAFHCALARQCFINEYVFDLTADEASRARRLRDDLAAALKAGTSIPVLWPAAVAAYFALHSLPLADRLLDKKWPDAVSDVLTQQLREPEEERQYGAAIPRLTAIENDVSLRVRRQYEENPYPRWIKAPPAGKPTTIDELLRRRFPSVTFRALDKTSDIDILIAGCGTGQQSIDTAQRIRGARVLAVDLSLTSLGYAKRKTLALGLNTIEYAQADILNLGSLGRRFDIIESVGVLHHLDDPMTGWRILLSLLRPGGFMRLGFYSDAARRDIVRAREFLAGQGYGHTTEEIRRARQALIDCDDEDGFETAVSALDFFTVSEFRDLVFHVKEHRLTLPDIAAFLEENHLQFLGFNLESRIVEQYRARFPQDKAANDLELWQVFETENPDSFAAMYQFWIQKP